MSLDSFAVLLAQAQQQQAPPWATFVMIVPMFVIMYVLFIRPQQKQQKEKDALLKTLKSGDKVVSSGGIVGVVITVKEKENSVTLRSGDTKLELLKTAIVEIKERAGATSEAKE
jgi:preprotein translocase subunit YajC